MTVFVCIDDNKGMMFNNRRQSRDSAVIIKIIEMSKEHRLLMSGYSAKLFEGYDVMVDDNFLGKAEIDDCCFVEKNTLGEYDKKISKLVLFKWNKVYPSDKFLDISFDGRVLEGSFEFEGSSHDRITCEVWVK